MAEFSRPLGPQLPRILAACVKCGEPSEPGRWCLVFHVPGDDRPMHLECAHTLINIAAETTRGNG